MDTGDSHSKAHRAPRAGKKADKKAKKRADQVAVSQAGATAKQKNPKAFAIQNVKKLQKKVKRTLDIKEKKVHAPVVDRTPLEPPPIIVAIVGPPKVGKTTLMKNLIRSYTQQKLSEIKGPVTVVTGKKRRITFIECRNDMNSMIDIAKIADLVLLLVDASFGMEMETFEFLNICQVHGFPRIMGVLTHLDHFKNSKRLKNVRKTLKHRFWTEIYQGAKLFYLSGMMYGEYLKNEIHNLTRFISVMKFRPLVWRNSHPYIFSDRIEDITDPEQVRSDGKINRTISFYGWMRGAPLRNNSTVHIPGCGDHVVQDISFLPDPCPLPDKLKRRSLNDMEKKLYAPMSGVGGVLYDKDAVYIDIAHQQKQNKEVTSEQEYESDIKSAIITSHVPLDKKLEESSLNVFSNSQSITSQQFSESQRVNEEVITEGGRVRRRAVFNNPIPEDIDSMSDNEDTEFNEETEDKLNQIQDGEAADYSYDDDSEDDKIMDQSEHSTSRTDQSRNNHSQSDQSEEEVSGEGGADTGHLKWKENLARKAAENFINRQKSVTNLQKLVYDMESQREDAEKDEVDDLFSVVKPDNRLIIDDMETSRLNSTTSRDWSSSEARDYIIDCFMTGDWGAGEDASKRLKEDEELFGDFEDLESGEAHGGGEGGDKSNSDISEGSDNSDNDSDNESNEETEQHESDDPDVNNQKSRKLTKEERSARIAEKRAAKKKRMKDMFDTEYDKQTNGDGETVFEQQKQELHQQAQLNRSEFEDMDDSIRVLYEGYRAGLYVRVEIKDVPCEFIHNFNPNTPIVLGGITTAESVIGLTQIRIKKHRWYGKILKTRDPLIFSIGWRRFQSLPIYAVKDHNGRNRQLKYTPQHLHCNAVFWGPATPQNSGVLCLQNISSSTRGFRVAATGVVLALDKSICIQKKLKLIGYPMKIHSKTAFIKDMFTSELEVAKFEGAKIQTVSGIRGQVKKAIRNPKGSFRATFEDTILMSDIVFLKSWYQVDIPKFYNPVTNLLQLAEHENWNSMKTVGLLRAELGIKAPFSKDSQYIKEPVRKEQNIKPFSIPRGLQKHLPFKFKPKVRGKIVDPVLEKRVAVVRDAHEKKTAKLLSELKAIKAEQHIKTVTDRTRRVADHRKRQRLLDDEKQKRKQKARKEIFRELGRMKKKTERAPRYAQDDDAM